MGETNSLPLFSDDLVCHVRLARVQPVLTLDTAAQSFDDFRRAAGPAQSCVLSCPKWGKVVAALFFGGGLQCAGGCACQGKWECCVIHRTGFAYEAVVESARRAAVPLGRRSRRRIESRRRKTRLLRLFPILGRTKRRIVPPRQRGGNRRTVVRWHRALGQFEHRQGGRCKKVV